MIIRQLKHSTLTLLSVLALLCVSIPPAHGQATGKALPYIIFVGHARDYNNSWTIFRNGLIAGMNRLHLNIELRNSPTGNLEDIDALVVSAIRAKPDGLILSAPREDLARKWASMAQAANIPVVLVGSSGLSDFVNTGPFPLISIGQDNYQAGFTIGKKLRKDNVTNVICMVPRTDVDEHLLRCRGASDGLDKDIPVFSLDDIDGNLNDFFESYLAENPNLQNIIITEITGLSIIQKTLEQFPNGKKISMVSFGLTRKAAYQLQSKDRILFIIDSQPFLQGYSAAMIYNNYFRHGVVWGNSHISTGPDIMTSGKVRKIASFAGSIR